MKPGTCRACGFRPTHDRGCKTSPCLWVREGPSPMSVIESEDPGDYVCTICRSAPGVVWRACRPQCLACFQQHPGPLPIMVQVYQTRQGGK